MVNCFVCQFTAFIGALVNFSLVSEHIVKWLDQYCSQSKMSGFVVGVSGGVDSAVTSTLCALTGKAVSVISMPIYQKKHQLELAQQHMDWMDQKFSNVEKNELDLSAVFGSIEKHFPTQLQDPLTMANTRSRLRMLTLYAYAGSARRLVAGTGNKVEDFGVGFFTKYGDGGVDLSPIADLGKTEVYGLAKHLEIVKGILDAAPTDGLWEDDRTDESQLGASYEELEWAMKFEKKNSMQTSDEQTLNGRQREVLTIYRQFHSANKHKMVEIPVCKIPDTLY
ncbi:MAG: NAD(+) synthase [Pseudomonadales bacterium]